MATSPRIVLPALKAPGKKMHHLRRRAASSNMADEKLDSPMQALLLAVEDMRLLVGHVANLLSNECMAEVGITRWLNRLDEVVTAIVSSVRSGKISSVHKFTIDDEVPESLENALHSRFYAEELNWPATAHYSLLARLVDYWLDQICARGLSLLHLIIDADDVISAGKSLAKLNEIRYPLDSTAA